MFCRYCGKEIDNDQMYCPFCGKQVKKNAKKSENEKTDAPSEDARFVNEQYEKDKRREERPAAEKKKLKGSTIAIIVLSALVAAGLGIGAFVMFGNSGGDTVEVDLESLMYETSAFGYDGHGEMDEEMFVDEQKMDAFLGTIEDEQLRSAVKGVLLTVKYHPDKYIDLSNGDRVRIKADYDREMAAAVEMTVKNESFEYTVEGLEEGEDIAYDPETCDQYAEDFVFSESDDRNLTDEEIGYAVGFDVDMIQRGINEIYARHGMIFTDSFYKKYYEKCSWYTPVYKQEEIKSSWLNKYENANLKALSEYRQEIKNMQEEDKYAYCFSCGKKMKKEDAIEYNDTFYCEDCFDDL